ncbi:hypothetical protein hmeg3_13075 [Herbaspirillum sp. meg3]|nr:hypothetical protein hmeg3_13075 [Herbaspirillum sp. meg3]
MLMYGVALNQAIARGNLSEMRELATVSAYLKRTQTDDLESDESKEWDEAHKQLLASIAEKEAIKLAKEDIVAIRDGFVVLDNIQVARALKTLLDSDSEGPYIKISFGWD